MPATEQGGEGWILSVHETREEAETAEAIWQNRYGIPGTAFTFREAQGRALSDGQLAEIHEAAKDMVKPRVEKLFRDTQLQMDQPLYGRISIESEDKAPGNIFTTAAGNLTPMSEHLRVMVPKPGFLEGGNKPEDIRPMMLNAKVTLEEFEGTVYGLDVPPDHHYISGGAVVHNSVKGGEADVVFIFPDLSAAGSREWTGTQEQRAGIIRLFYVGMTRARESLVLCRPVGRNYVDI